MLDIKKRREKCILMHKVSIFLEVSHLETDLSTAMKLCQVETNYVQA